MPRNFHSLKKPKIRQDWSKYTLYNITRSRYVDAQKTFFQQKWDAKSHLRAYHNPYVRERQWERMFDRRLPAVVPMDYRYLAQTDGRELSAGRGSGLVKEDLTQGPARLRSGSQETTPYMNMAFHPLEKRLDTAIFRAMFASSTKQARQMVIHGSVKVNGKQMVYPGYCLNPGDMFSVEPDRVLFATGAPKLRKDSPLPYRANRFPQERGVSRASTVEEPGKSEGTTDESIELPDAGKTEAPSNNEITTKADTEETTAGDSQPPTVKKDAGSSTSSEDYQIARKSLKALRDRAKSIVTESKTDLSAKRIQDLRAFAQSVQKTLSQYGKKDGVGVETPIGDSVEDLETALLTIMSKIPADVGKGSSKNSTRSNADAEAGDPEDSLQTRKDAELFHAALQRARENPIDTSKPYATPWRPRPYMSAFAFIPRYLEVNHNICSAVYLRHPVARPGLAEVPTPFSPETSQLGFNWYLRRR